VRLAWPQPAASSILLCFALPGRHTHYHWSLLQPPLSQLTYTCHTYNSHEAAAATIAKHQPKHTHKIKTSILRIRAGCKTSFLEQNPSEKLEEALSLSLSLSLSLRVQDQFDLSPTEEEEEASDCHCFFCC